MLPASINLDTSEGREVCVCNVSLLVKWDWKDYYLLQFSIFLWFFNWRDRLPRNKMCSHCVEGLFYVPAEPDEGTLHLGFYKQLNHTLPWCKIIQNTSVGISLEVVKAATQSMENIKGA